MIRFFSSWKLSDLYTADQIRQAKSVEYDVSLRSVHRKLRKSSISEKFKALFFRNKAQMNNLLVTFELYVQGGGSGYPVFIELQYDPDMILYTENQARVYCGCPDFKFNSAYLLEQHNALYRSDETDLKLGPAITTSPKRARKSGVLCKHSYAAVGWLIRNYNRVMSYV